MLNFSTTRFKILKISILFPTSKENIEHLFVRFLSVLSDSTSPLLNLQERIQQWKRGLKVSEGKPLACLLKETSRSATWGSWVQRFYFLFLSLFCINPPHPQTLSFGPFVSPKTHLMKKMNKSGKQTIAHKADQLSVHPCLKEWRDNTCKRMVCPDRKRRTDVSRTPNSSSGSKPEVKMSIFQSCPLRC